MTLEFTLGTRVQCVNRFGHFYLRMIAAAHRHYIAPTMLATAVERGVLTASAASLPDMQPRG